MPNLKTLRSQLESAVNSFGETEGRIKFVEEIKESVGLLTRDSEGNLIESVDDNGNPALAKGSWKPEEYSLRNLAIAIGGHSFYESMEPGEGPDMKALLEAGPGIDPTNFINTNVFSASVAGLVEAKVMEKFKNAEFIGDQLFDTVPTNLNGEKMIGTGGLASTAGDGTRKPGEPHQRAQFGDRWVQTPELEEKALAVEVTQEAVWYDKTNEVLQVAGEVGDSLAYGREKTMLRLFAGITNNYTYKGVAYDTYQATTPWINTHANEAATYADVDEANELFTNMTNPETGREIMIDRSQRVLVIDETKESLWNFILNSTQVKEVSSNTSMYAPAPASAKSLSQPLMSVILRNLLIASGLTATQAKGYWFIGNPKKAFKWMEHHPLRVRSASPNEYVMLDRGLIAAYFADYRGIGAVVEPRYMVRNTKA
jgi:hypothetical protein